MAATAPQPQAPDWDLTAWFSALGAPDYREFRRDLERDLAALLERAQTLAPVADDSAGWVAFLCDLEAAGARTAHLGSFIGCWTAADSADELGQREEASLGKLRALQEKAWIRVRAVLRDTTDRTFMSLVGDERLQPVRYALERERRLAAQRMSVELESLSTDLAVDGFDAWGRLYDRISGNLRFELAVKGHETETHPVSMTRTLLEDPDPDVRRAALRGSAAAWQSVADPVAACLNAIAGTRLTLYERRGVQHFLDPALFTAGIEGATLDAMWDAVRSRQEVARRFLRHKAGLLGKPKLGFQDLMAPLPRSDDARIPWSDAVTRVCDAFGAAYPSLRAFAGHAFEARWIDYRPRPAKRPGGFCTGSPLIGESRVFMTYHGSTGDVQTLAHELGHAFHGWLMKDMRPWQRRYPMTLAEAASTFAEKLVTDAALEAPGITPEARAALLETRLQDAEAFLLNIPMRFDFECALYEARAAGEVPVSQLKEMMLDAQRANYGDALDPDDLDPWFWASKLHFYITDLSFYNFPYTFGYLFSMGLYARAKAEGPAFLPRYEALLRATGSAPAEQVAADTLGVDLRRPDFWNASIDRVEADLDAFVAATRS